MVLDTLQSWVTVGMCFALAVLMLWIWHDVTVRRPRGRHKLGIDDLVHQDGDDWIWP